MYDSGNDPDVWGSIAALREHLHTALQNLFAEERYRMMRLLSHATPDTVGSALYSGFEICVLMAFHR